MMYYRRLCKGLTDKGTLVPVGDEYSSINNPDKDYYLSIYYYNKDQYDKFQKSGTVAGITDTVTPYLAFDFDSESDLEASRKDTLELCSRLIAHGLNESDFTICFSGNKGFSVEVLTNNLFSPSDFKNITKALAGDLPTRDSKIVNPSRIFRVPNTKHQSTGLYKLPITLGQLSSLPSEVIKDLAKDASNAAEWSINEVVVPASILALKETKEIIGDLNLSNDLSDLDYSQRPKDMPACKYSILNGYFKKGHRNDCLMALAAHFKSRGYPKEITYNLLKGAARLQAQRSPNDMPIEKSEIWNTVIQSVYGPNWQGKTYSCKNHDFLKELCPKGEHSCEKAYGKNKEVVSIETVSSIFRKYAEDIDKNTILTGIKEIDEKIRLQTKSHVVIAACSGVGKTTTILNILRNASAKGQYALFGSLDMSDALVYQKLAQSVTGMNDKELFLRYKEDLTFRSKVDASIATQYKHTLFDFSSGVTIDQLYERLYKAKVEHGDNLRIAVYDYINLISGPFSDANANLAYIAPKLKDLANELDLLVISLAQIARDKGGPATPLKDSRVAKGSSAIEESATVLFGMWREFYNTPNDNYISIAALKTRMGKEFKQDLYWNGMSGEIRGLTSEEAHKLEELREEKEMQSEGINKTKLMYKNFFGD